MVAGKVSQLQATIRGQVLEPGSEAYDTARKIWNGMIDRQPAMIAQCRDTKDVVEAVKFARENDLLVAVKGGGHNVAGNAMCDGGIVIDLSEMRSVQVNPATRTVGVQGGALLGDVDQATQPHGLAVSAGIVSHTGVGGLTLGGGFGWISRKHGLTIDNLLSAELVTAEGKVVTASKDENDDLFWGIRGGGGNFGIATSFEFRGAEIGSQVYSGLVVHPFDNAKAYLQFYRDYVRKLADEMTVWTVIRHAPPLPFLPPEVHGRLVVVAAFIYLGDAAQGEKLIEPVRKYGQPHGEAIGMNPWTGWQSGFDALNSHFARNYWKSHQLTGLPDAFLDEVIAHAESFPSPDCEFFIPHLEGVQSRVPVEATAFAHRTTPFLINVHTRWTDPADDDKCVAWARDFFERTKPFAKGVYVNFLSDEGEDRVHDAYPKGTWDRLVKLKSKYDPANFFRLNQNVKPAA